jgi:ribosomal protein S4
MGIAPSRRGARQLVSQDVTVNGDVVILTTLNLGDKGCFVKNLNL